MKHSGWRSITTVRKATRGLQELKGRPEDVVTVMGAALFAVCHQALVDELHLADVAMIQLGSSRSLKFSMVSAHPDGKESNE